MKILKKKKKQIVKKNKDSPTKESGDQWEKLNDVQKRLKNI